MLFLCILFIFVFMGSSSDAEVYSYSKDTSVIGSIKTYKVKEGESLIEIARDFDLGYNEIVDSNPGLDPYIPGTGISVKIPASWVLPDVALYNGILINLSEMRLYYFFTQKELKLVRTFPIGIGDEGTDTPVGKYRIIEKLVKPSWHVPKSIKKEKPELPNVVPPGPDNPLGSHALRLSLNTILIHGTNKPWGVGRRVSHGCIRLYPEDIPKLFQLVPNGAKVTIIRQPVKVGLKNNKVYIEVHKDDSLSTGYFNEAVNLLRKKNLLKRVNTEKLYRAVIEKSAIPVEISD
ncbi:MAG: L,D-transpeptidase family protein [Nitrospirota bacterium]|nr:L,D-transpeptidase family protein [Nitrospirota bacterium]MDH5768322.1 L,D-transpeptidase family protein [Nitrospirota bacterium]